MKLSSTPGPIAVFDSGYGGLTVLQHLIKELPEYNFLYLGDNARTPYGTRSFDVVYSYTLAAVEELFRLGAHLVILACNTASAKALRNIQQIDLPRIDPTRRVLGVIRPSVEVIPNVTMNNHVGVFGTPGTVASQSYPLEISKINSNIVITQEACPMWVPLVENNEALNEGADYFVKKSIDALFEKDPLIDTVVLGCTHYPILLPKITKYIPENVKILGQGELVAASLKDYLFRHPEMDKRCKKESKIEFYTTENPEKFHQMASLFFEGEIDVKHLSY